MKLHTSNNHEIHSNYISLQEIKYHRRFQCSSVFRGFENSSYMNFAFAEVSHPNSTVCENIIFIKL